MQLKKYLQDRPIFFLNILIFFFAVFSTLSTLLRVDNSRAAAIIRYQVWQGQRGGIQGSPLELYGFAFFSIIMLFGGLFFAYKLYNLNRNYSLIVLSLTLVALVFNIVISGAILNLQ
ncbi:hypothetical protein KA043_03855 [Candidatus Saccharibacteria bacterium]|nr:hypothetical protein [Candidatus Saccharibacteria bacterium]